MRVARFPLRLIKRANTCVSKRYIFYNKPINYPKAQHSSGVTESISSFLLNASNIATSTLTESAQYLYGSLLSVIASLNSLNIEKLASDAQKQTKKLITAITQTGEVARNLGTEAKDSLNVIIASVNQIANDESHPINEMHVNIPGAKGAVLNYIPMFKTIEHLFKCIVFMSLNATLQFLMSSKYFSELDQETKDKIVIEISDIFIKNVIDPVNLSTELVSFLVSKIDMSGIANYELLVQLGKYANMVQEVMSSFTGVKRK